VIRFSAQARHAIVGLGQPDRPTPADAEVETAADLDRRAGLIRTPAIAHAVGRDRHPEYRDRPLRAHRARLQGDERGEPSRTPRRESGAGQQAELTQPLAPGSLPGLRRQLGDETQPAATSRKGDTEHAAMGQIAVRAQT